jgi:DNA primase
MFAPLPAERVARQQRVERDRMFRVMDTAAAFFQEQYASLAGAAVRAYVEKRGIGATVAAGSGSYAPSRWDGLSSFLASKKIPASTSSAWASSA